MTILFLVSALFVVYTYALFPLFLHLRAKGKSLPSIVTPTDWPTVSIVIAAHNEAKNLPTKLTSLEALDYPAELVEWIIVSDGSTDGTHALLQEAFDGHPRRHVRHLESALGKCGALNAGVSMASHDIILFMDARQPVSENAIRKLVPYFSHEQIGAVSGELVLSEDGSLEAANFGLYWRYEKWIRDNESRLFSTTGATGALYAVRRADFTPNAVGTLLDDFNTPVEQLKKGKRTLFVPGAYAFDEAADDIKQEFRRKVRNLAGNWQSFQTHSWLFNPARNPVWWQFLSHKFFRLLVPYALIIAFLSAWFGDGLFLELMFYSQLAFYAAAAASFADLPGTGNKVFTMIKIFTQLNLAAFIATARFFLSGKAISWR
ncbi:glycosyltransferase family 2 protein [Granulosicoccus sp. 3-233]|uniref:glycosyltransferase family 2 protein n=1 Tax=Granulosicoccus sp. 3-233 TaxID=3417969 RepID=UPI003D339287